MFNLKALAISTTADFPLRDAAGNPQYDENGKPLTITLYGPASHQYQQAKHAATEQNSKEIVDRMSGKGETQKSWLDKSKQRAEFLAQCTASFNGFGMDGLEGHSLFVAVYSDTGLGHIADDAEKALGDRAKFMSSSKKS